MKTRCLNCQTIFRVTPDQLKARAGKVRCGQCQTVFNALDSLLEEQTATVPPIARPIHQPLDVPRPAHNTPESEPEPPATPTPFPAIETPLFIEIDTPAIDEPTHPFDDLPPAEAQKMDILLDYSAKTDEARLPQEPYLSDAPAETQMLSESAAQELGRASGLILPRETTAIPGYSKWAEGVMSEPVSLPEGKATRWPFILASILLIIALAGQLVFRFRGEIATTNPGLQPLLATLSQVVGSDLPLPRHVDLVSIEVSDLQSDPAHDNLLVLNATLRNRASYGQAYPSLELSLTDTQDAAIARRVIAPAEYLPARIQPGQPFAANADLAVRLWIEAKSIAAAGYRLYVFYP